MLLNPNPSAGDKKGGERKKKEKSINKRQEGNVLNRLKLEPFGHKLKIMGKTSTRIKFHQLAARAGVQPAQSKTAVHMVEHKPPQIFSNSKAAAIISVYICLSFAFQVSFSDKHERELKTRWRGPEVRSSGNRLGAL